MIYWLHSVSQSNKKKEILSTHKSNKTIQINLIKFRQVHHNTALQYFFMMRAPITCLVKETLPKEQRTVEKFISIFSYF